MNKIVIDGVEIRIADDFVVDEGVERWVGEYYFFPNGACLQVFQEPVHGYYIKIEARSLDMLKTDRPTQSISARSKTVCQRTGYCQCAPERIISNKQRIESKAY